MNYLGNFLIILTLCCAACGKDEKTASPKTKTPKTSKTLSKSEPKTEPEKFQCLIGEIPDYIKKQNYKDKAGNSVTYDHEAQIRDLCALKDQGKELFLIIGRGNAETHQQPLDTQDGKRVWVYGQKSEQVLVKDNKPHLWMNFDDDESLKSLPEGLFEGIAFDLSVVKFFDNMADSAAQFYRVLKPKGQLYVDASAIDGYAIIPDRAPLKQICTTRRGTLHKAKSGLDYCLLSIIGGTFLVPGETSPQDEVEIGNKVKSLFFKRLATIFGVNKCQEKTSEYPVKENNSEYFECTK